MLIEFSVGNFLSIKDRQTLRLDASSISEHRDQLIDAGRYKLLRSAVIYGANASGKSNVLKAMAVMGQIVEKSAQQSSTTEIDVEPFLLNTETESSPSYFEVLFLISGIRYRYGFEVNRKAVKAEWLFIARKKQEKPLFLRESSEVIKVFNDFKEGKGLEERTRDNALFLAVCDQFNGKIAKQIFKWFKNFVPLSGLQHENYRLFLSKFMEIDMSFKTDLMNIVKNTNLGFADITIENIEQDDNLSKAIIDLGYHDLINFFKGKITDSVKTIHKKYNLQNEYVGDVLFDMDKNESSGTKKFFDLIPIIILAMSISKILIVDELDAKLHPLMTQAVIRLFNNPELNSGNAQLIFATHDTNLLSAKLFRRDQIYFTEKDQYGATSLYSLVEYQEEDGAKVRKDRSFEEDYIRGRYGAIPFIGDLSKLAS